VILAIALLPLQTLDLQLMVVREKSNGVTIVKGDALTGSEWILLERMTTDFYAMTRQSWLSKWGDPEK
jgi:hypothetical protein